MVVAPMPTERALVIVNPRARRGDAVARYERIRSEVEAGLRVRHVVMDAAGQWIEALEHARREGLDRVVAVGGDGTVHAVANALLSDGPVASGGPVLGAVGLGSSNDFHKPVRSRARGVPVRCGPPAPRDVGLARWEDARGVEHARWFVVSASVGLTARANRRFSRPSRDGRLSSWLGARSVKAAIALAAAGALAAHHNVRARVLPSEDASPRQVEVSNLSVMLTPYLAGSFRYDAALAPGGGRFALHLCEGMSRPRLMMTMAELLRGRFEASPGTSSWSSRDVQIDLEEEDELELDGELFRARSVRFQAFGEALAVCA